MAGFGEEVEGLRLHARRGYRRPLQVGLGQRREGRLPLSSANGLDGFRTILGLLRSRDVRQSRRRIVSYAVAGAE